MLRQRDTLTFVAGLSVWLAVVLLAAAALLSFTDQVSAQQGSTESTLSTPTLSAETDENGMDLSWTSVAGAVRYELWAWNNTDGWHQIGGDSLTGTTYSHTAAKAGMTYYYTVVQWTPRARRAIGRIMRLRRHPRRGRILHLLFLHRR